jgi:hypothetical protein
MAVLTASETLTAGEWLLLGVGLGQLSAWVFVLIYACLRRKGGSS